MLYFARNRPSAVSIRRELLSKMEDSREANEEKEKVYYPCKNLSEQSKGSPAEPGNMPSSDDEQDVHYCGRCKLSFTDLSDYFMHKANKACRDTNKSTLKEVVEKLPISLNNKFPEISKEQCCEGADGSSADNCKITKDDVVTVENTASLAKRVEVQFLDPLLDVEPTEVLNSTDGEKSSKPPKRHKRKNSHPKTTRKRKSSSSTTSPGIEKIKEAGDKKTTKSSDGSVSVHIPESQLVHLNSTSPTSSSSPAGVVVRKQGATSVFVPIYLNQPSKVYKCQRCPAVFKTLDEKEDHCKLHKKDFKCTLCSKSFFTISGFEQHRLAESHSHPCDECGKVFTSTVQLKKHKTTHSTDRPFACDQCDKTFCSAGNLRSHTRTVHATEKRHKCPECGKAFARKDKMKRHSLIHYPDTRPTFLCPFRSHTGCMKTFYREDKLKRHLFTHSKDKPFKCDQCNKGYARRDNLNDHMRIHTGNYTHICEICKKGFLGPHKLKKHMKSVHKQIEPNVESFVTSREHPPTMVPLDSHSLPLVTACESTSQSNTVATQSLGEEDPEALSPGVPLEDDAEAFDISVSESEAEGMSGDEEHQVNKAGPTPITSQSATSQAHDSATVPHMVASHGPVPRTRPVPRASAAPHTFMPPPLPIGLHASAEMMAFSQELFNIVCHQKIG